MSKDFILVLYVIVNTEKQFEYLISGKYLVSKPMQHSVLHFTIILTNTIK